MPSLNDYSASVVMEASKSLNVQRDRAVGSNDTGTSYSQALTACLATIPANSIPRGVATWVVVFPFSIGAGSYELRINRWLHHKGTGTSPTSLYIPIAPAVFTVTTDSPTGVASNELLLNTELLTKTLVEVVAPDAPECQFYNANTANYASYIMLDLKGCDRYSFDYDLGTVTSANVLHGTL